MYATVPASSPKIGTEMDSEKNTYRSINNKEHCNSLQQYLDTLRISEKALVKEIIRLKAVESEDKMLKEEIMAQISHEIRTPLNIITNYTAMLEDEMAERGLLDEFNLFFKAIHKGSQRIIRTIDLIIDFSRLESGLYQPNPEEFDIYYDVLASVLLRYKDQVENKGLLVNCDISQAEKRRVYTDLYSVEQIFDQLLSNAVKFTFKGRIDVFLRNVDNKLVVEINDTGIGMSQEYLHDVFTPFFQEDRGYTRKFDGNGLGLPLAKKYCELNNILMKIVSKKGEGTSITLEFNL